MGVWRSAGEVWESVLGCGGKWGVWKNAEVGIPQIEAQLPHVRK